MCLLLSVCIAFSFSVNAQLVNEWLRQNATQRKYLAQQIVALQAHIIQLKKGYDIARKGYNTIHSIKNGELSLHSGFFSGLKTVNPKIRKYQRVADIIANQVTIIQVCHANARAINKSGRFGSFELESFSSVTSALLAETTNTIDQLSCVILNGRYEMSDDERLMRIDKLFAQSNIDVQASLQLSEQIRFIDYSRLKDQTETLNMKMLYGLH